MELSTIKFGLLGASGKMGNAILAAGQKMELDIVYYARSMDAYTKDEVFDASDVVIDFSSHQVAIEHVKLAEKYSKPILIGTTGHLDPEQLVSNTVAILYAPNTCVEWAILKNAVKQLVENNRELVMSLDDIHAKTKQDSPSGTAKDLLRFVHKEQEVTTRSIRKVNLASWHRISLFDTDQVINLEHQVLNREVYAIGALKFAAKLPGLSAGLYKVEDLFYTS